MRPLLMTSSNAHSPATRSACQNGAMMVDKWDRPRLERTTKTWSVPVFHRHGPDSGFPVSKFSKGTSMKDISAYVDNALRYGKVSQNGPTGYVVEYNVGKIIGTNTLGNPTNILKVNVRDGVIHTAFPL